MASTSVPWWVIVSAGNTAVIQSAAKPAGYQSVKGPYSTQAAAQSAAGGSGSPASTPAGGACGPQAIYQALITAGFSTAQAIGAVANAIAESAMDPEARVVDSNGYYSDGLWQFNEESYPNAASLVTGNCAADITAQVGYLVSHVSGQALEGSTGAEVAGNFAANFERCQGCSAGSTAANGWSTRVANAAQVQQWVTSGSWPTSTAALSSSGGSSTVTTSYATGTCALPLSVPIVGSFCLLSKSQARGAIGGLLMVGAAALAIPGLVILAAAGLGGIGGAGGSAALSAAERVPGYGHAIRAARS